MRKRMALAIGVLAALLAFTACKREQPPSAPSLPPQRHYGETAGTETSRTALQQFVAGTLSGSHGVYTNYRDTPQSAEAAGGHETLSESAGLLLRYYALSGQRAAFDAEWERTKRTFDSTSGFSYRYSPLLGKKYPLNAAVDDLRIIRALYEAAQKFGEAGYAREADGYGRRFLENNVKNGRLYDFYDETYRKTNDFITLCYIDFRTLRLLPDDDKTKEERERSLLAIVRGGYLGDDFPFYETRYTYDTGDYSDHDGAIGTVESLLTVLELAEVRQHNPASIRYVKERVAAGALYGQYTRTGEPANDVQSTAIYALAAMIGSELGDKALYEDSIRAMERYRIKDAASPLHGGFGDAAAAQAYSFDNLMALLAYAY